MAPHSRAFADAIENGSLDHEAGRFIILWNNQISKAFDTLTHAFNAADAAGICTCSCFAYWKVICCQGLVLFDCSILFGSIV